MTAKRRSSSGGAIGENALENDNAVKLARHVIRLFYENGQVQKSRYCSKDMVCFVPNVGDRHDIRIFQFDCKVCMDRHDAWFLMGNCIVSYKTGDDREKSAKSRYSMLLQREAEGVFLTALHISEKHGEEFCLTDVMERTHYLHEADILYLESGHNRIYWHTGCQVIEVTGYLQHAETGLPENFIRIHKSFIVNLLHVEQIERCRLRLSNGEILQIPVKKYTEVRQKITAGKRGL